MDFTDQYITNMPLLQSGETWMPVTTISVSNPGKGITSMVLLYVLFLFAVSIYSNVCMTSLYLLSHFVPISMVLQGAIPTILLFVKLCNRMSTEPTSLTVGSAYLEIWHQ